MPMLRAIAAGLVSAPLLIQPALAQAEAPLTYVQPLGQAGHVG